MTRELVDALVTLPLRERQRIEVLPAIRLLGSNTTWGSPIRNRNVLFLPRR